MDRRTKTIEVYLEWIKVLAVAAVASLGGVATGLWTIEALTVWRWIMVIAALLFSAVLIGTSVALVVAVHRALRHP